MRKAIAQGKGGIVLILATLFAVQCVKSEPQTAQLPDAMPRPAPQTTTSKSPPAVERKREPRPQPKPKDAISLSPQPSPDSKVSPRVSLQKATDLFASFPQQRIMANDFKIGALQDGITSSRDFLKGLACVRSFMASIINKKVDYSLVLPKVLSEMKAVINYPLAQGYVPQKYRIGKMVFDSDDELRANIRLYKDDAVTEGEIYLTKADDEWKISDIQAGFTLLAKPYRKSPEPFNPGSYEFLLEK